MPVRRIVCLFLLLPLLGCGVSKQIWLGEVEKREEFEKQLAICEAGQRSGQRREEALQRDLTAAQTAAAEAQQRLTEAAEREQGVRAALEGCREVRQTVETDRDRLRERLASEAEARAAASGRTEVVTAESRRLRQELETAQQASAEALARGRELGAERDLLRQELEGEHRRGVAAAATAAELQGRLAALAEERERVEQEKAARLREVESSYEELLQGMKSELEKGQVTISQLQGRLSVNVLDEILFASGRAEINPQGQEVLARVGEVVEGMTDKTIAIEGHTDAVPVTGQLAKMYPSNWELSAARATSVVRYLQTTAGIEPERLSAVGLGPYHPVDTNDTPEGRARNRRIEIKLVPREPAADQAAIPAVPAAD